MAYPNTQEMSSRSTMPTTRAAERERRACLLQNGFLVARLSLHDQEQVYNSSFSTGRQGERGTGERSPPVRRVVPQHAVERRPRLVGGVLLERVAAVAALEVDA